MLVDFRVVQLLCSRLCHDLVGPAGAVNAGLELMRDDGVGTGEALALIELSAQQVARRLAFYRLAFGLGGESGGTSAVSDTRKLVDGFLSGGKVILDWPAEAPTDAQRRVSGGTIKLILNLALLGIEALPRGGSLTVRFADLLDGMGVAMTAFGNNACFKEEFLNAMGPNVAPDELSVRTAQGYFSARLAEQLATNIEISEGPDGSVRLAVVVPNP